MYATLSAEGGALLLANIPHRWRAMFATAAITRMRKGELIGLRKSCVDLANRTIVVANS